MKKIITLILALMPVICALGQEKSQWLLHNRQHNAYIYDDGKVVKSSPAPYDESYVWLMEAGEGADVKIVNKKTGRYIMGDDSAWNIGGFFFDSQESAGWYTLSKDATLSDMNLVLTPGGLDYVSTDRYSDYSSHWTFVRLDSEKIPYVISSDYVSESSFLGERKAVALSDTEMTSDYRGDRTWNLSKDISVFPKMTAKGNTIVPALYNMALEESILDIRPADGTFMAGALWPDTWTRDVVYSIYFAYSWIMPEVSRKTLEKQTLKSPSEALQDTGSGGSYPISTDRVVWALAAWEYYLATGDKEWLKQTYEGLSYTARKDIHVAYDENVHLFKGETCSMDWRKHTYPNWFTNANIGESFSSGTNALHYFLYRFLLMSGNIIGAPEEDIALWTKISEELRAGMNQSFWSEKYGMYTCYLYPEILGYQSSKRVGAMSNGLAALLGVADEKQVRSIVANSPLYAYGAAVLYPSKPDSFAYHNKGIWPVWQTPLMYAAKKCGNHAVVEHLVNSAVRAGALFLTHKENMTYDTGYDCNTALNSDRQLWSVASYLSIVYRIFFGMEMTDQGMTFTPVIPSWMGDEIRLTDFKYRKAVLDITVKGKGSEIVTVKVNGRLRKPSYVLPANARGRYQIEIVVKESEENHTANVVAAGPGHCWSPVEPVIRLENGKVFWTTDYGYTYRLYGEGVMLDNVHSPLDITSLPDGYYSLCAVDADGMESDLSNPVLKSSWNKEYQAGIEDYRDAHQDFSIEFEVPENGDYAIWFTGRNGRGPHNTFCAIRSLYLDGKDFATILLEAYGDWNETTLSNHVVLKDLKKGTHCLTIRFNPENAGYDNNMSFNKENWNDWIVETLNIVKL